MKILVLTDDLVGPAMAGSALRAWELSRVLLDAGHDVLLAAGAGSAHPEGHGPPVVTKPSWGWPEVVLSPPWCLPPRAFIGDHLLVIDGTTPLLAELGASPQTPEIKRRHRTAAARLPLVAARADAILVASDEQTRWWKNLVARRSDVPIIEVPFGIPTEDPAAGFEDIEGVPSDWAVVLWWGGVWPWLDLETLLAARARLESRKVSVVVPTARRPGGTARLTAEELDAAAERHGLKRPAVVPLERWVPYAERSRILNRSTILAVLHHPGPEVELSFRTRTLDGVWASVPMILSEGGAASRIASSAGWGAVVPPGDEKLAAAAIDLLLGERSQARCRSALTGDRPAWRWPAVAQPLVDALPDLSGATRIPAFPAAVRAAVAFAGRLPEGTS